MLRRRQLMGMQGGLLPAGYRQIEYLENSGTQYIATNFTPTMDSDVSVEWDFMFTVLQSNDNMMFGINVNSTSRVQAESFNSVRWYLHIANVGYRSILNGKGSNLNEKYSAKADSSKFTIIGEAEANPTDTYTTSTLVPLYIFAWNNNGSAGYINRGVRLYKLTFKKGNAITANFVPCIRTSDSEPGMYDTVSKTFYTNAGTGSFIVPA